MKKTTKKKKKKKKNGYFAALHHNRYFVFSSRLDDENINKLFGRNEINARVTTAHYRQKQRTRVASIRQLVSPSHVFLENNKIGHNIQH
jgi:hypothetical protein